MFGRLFQPVERAVPEGDRFGGGGLLEESVRGGEAYVSFEEASGFAGGFPLGGSFGDVGPGFWRQIRVRVIVMVVERLVRGFGHRVGLALCRVRCPEEALEGCYAGEASGTRLRCGIGLGGDHMRMYTWAAVIGPTPGWSSSWSSDRFDQFGDGFG